MDYLVEWRIDISADSPEEAAAKALSVQRDTDPLNSAVVFHCTNETGETVVVDLLDESFQD